MIETFNKIVLFIFTFILTWISAQKIDPKAKTILDGVTSNYQSKDNTYFKFTFNTVANKSTKTETGIFYAAKEKYRLKIMGTEQVFDGNKVYNINADEKEITIAKPKKDDEIFSPISFINEYKKGYNVAYIGKKIINGASLDYIKLTPVKNNGISQINLYLNAAKKQVVKLEQFSSNGDISTISITKYTENQKISPDTFTFNKALYKNYLVTEL